MSFIAGTSIAASVSQGALNQGQVAREQDAQRNHAARQAQLLKQASAKNLEAVEELDAVSDDSVIVDDERRHDGSQQSPHKHAVEDPKDGEDDDRPRRVDVTA